jgi:hypothetical protein
MGSQKTPGQPGLVGRRGEVTLDAKTRRRLRWFFKRLDTPARRNRDRPRKDKK